MITNIKFVTAANTNFPHKDLENLRMRILANFDAGFKLHGALVCNDEVYIQTMTFDIEDNR
jgi:hypothetical protein